MVDYGPPLPQAVVVVTKKITHTPCLPHVLVISHQNLCPAVVNLDLDKVIQAQLTYYCYFVIIFGCFSRIESDHMFRIGYKVKARRKGKVQRSYRTLEGLQPRCRG